MASFFQKFAFFFSNFFLHLEIHQTLAWSLRPVDTTERFIFLPLNRSYYHIQKPYDLPENQLTTSAMEFTDAGLTLQTSLTLPPAKPSLVLRLLYWAYNYSSGVWQFEGHWYVPRGTSGVCIMQVFGASRPRAPTLMLRAYNGSLVYYKGPVLVENV